MRDPAIPRGTVAAVATAVMLAGIFALPPYRTHLQTTLDQIRLLPYRIHQPLSAMQEALGGEPCRVAAWIRERTPENAAILLSDDRRDDRLTSTAWLAYYLYPRPLLTPAALRRDPSIRIDFVLLTPHFPPQLPDSLRGTGIGLAPFTAVAGPAGLGAKE